MSAHIAMIMHKTNTPTKAVSQHATKGPMGTGRRLPHEAELQAAWLPAQRILPPFQRASAARD